MRKEFTCLNVIILSLYYPLLEMAVHVQWFIHTFFPCSMCFHEDRAYVSVPDDNLVDFYMIYS